MGDLCQKLYPEITSLCSDGSWSWASCQTGQELWAPPSQQWPSWGPEHGIGLHGKGAAEPPFGAAASHRVASACRSRGKKLLGPVEQTLLVPISIQICKCQSLAEDPKCQSLEEDPKLCKEWHPNNKAPKHPSNPRCPGTATTSASGHATRATNPTRLPATAGATTPAAPCVAMTRGNGSPNCRMEGQTWQRSGGRTRSRPVM